MAEVFRETDQAESQFDAISPKIFLSSDNATRNELEDFIAAYGAGESQVNRTKGCFNALKMFSSWSLEKTAGLVWFLGIFRRSPMFLGNFLDSVRHRIFHGQMMPMNNENYHGVLDEINFKMNYFLSDFGRAQAMLLANNKTNMVDLALYFLPYFEQKHSFEEAGKSECTGDSIAELSHLSTSFCTVEEDSSCCLLEKLLSRDYEQVYSFQQYALDSLSTIVENEIQEESMRKMTNTLSTSPQKPFAFNSHPVIPACKFGTSFERLSSDCQYFSVTFSTDGLGYSFNSPKILDQYHAYSATKAFHKHLVMEKNQEKAWIRFKEVGKTQNKLFEALVTMPTRGISYSQIGFKVGDDLEEMQKYELSMMPRIQVSELMK